MSSATLLGRNLAALSASADLHNVTKSSLLDHLPSLVTVVDMMLQNMLMMSPIVTDFIQTKTKTKTETETETKTKTETKNKKKNMFRIPSENIQCINKITKQLFSQLTCWPPPVCSSVWPPRLRRSWPSWRPARLRLPWPAIIGRSL